MKTDIKRFNNTVWKAMPVVCPADDRRATIRVDDDGDCWEWVRTGLYTYAKPVKGFPYRNDLHRLMCQPKSFFKPKGN